MPLTGDYQTIACDGVDEAVQLFLKELRVYSHQNETKSIPASEFGVLLTRCHLDVGSSQADRFVGLCNILRNGDLDFSALLDSDWRANLTEDREISQFKEFKKLDNSLPSQSSIEQFGLSPKDRIRSLTKELHDIYRMFDTSQINLDQLRGELALLGIKETPQFETLMRNSAFGISFARFFHSLLQVSVNDVESLRPVIGLVAREGVNANGKLSNAVSIESEHPKAEVQSRSCLRNKIYSAIRALSDGSLTADNFQRVIKGLGIDPLPDLLVSLLRKAQCDGRVNFGQFAAAFEPYCRETNRSCASLNTAKDKFDTKDVTSCSSPTSRLDHGDIIAWTQDPSILKKLEEERLKVFPRRKYPAGKIPPYLIDHIRVNWTEESKASGIDEK